MIANEGVVKQLQANRIHSAVLFQWIFILKWDHWKYWGLNSVRGEQRVNYQNEHY